METLAGHPRDTPGLPPRPGIPLTAIVSSKIYAIKAADPLITVITPAATIVPATRASRLSPADALQSE